jgi:hypothetical protein
VRESVPDKPNTRMDVAWSHKSHLPVIACITTKYVTVSCICAVLSVCRKIKKGEELFTYWEMKYGILFQGIILIHKVVSAEITCLCISLIIMDISHKTHIHYMEVVSLTRNKIKIPREIGHSTKSSTTTTTLRTDNMEYVNEAKNILTDNLTNEIL